MIQQSPPPPVSAIQMLHQKRQKPDWTFGQMGHRATLKFGDKKATPDDPHYEMIKNLILQKYLGQLYGHK